MAGFYDGREYIQLDSIDALLDEILQERNRSRTIFAHNGGRFDFLFLCDAIKATGKQVHMITQGPRITALKIQLGDRHYVHLQDSFALLPESLANLCATFNPKTSKQVGAIDFENERVDKNNERHKSYLRSDCESLWHILKTYRELPIIRDVGLRLTRSSVGLAAFRISMKRAVRTTPDFVQEFVRSAYAGGRCEIFRQTLRNGSAVDANSLYPAMMLKPLPLEYIGESNDFTEFGFHDVTVQVPECYIPILWHKSPKLIFPTGIFRGTYFSEEIKLAISQGAKILKYHKGMHFSREIDFFKEYIENAYKMRLENPTGPLNTLGKDLMNHTYGKFAEREMKKSLIKVNQLDPKTWPKQFKYFNSEKMFSKTGLIEIERWHRAPHMLCHISAAVTAYGRCHMALNAYLPYASSIAYTDTDSAHGDINIGNKPELGAFKTEYSIKNAFYLLPKGYFIEKQDGKIIKKLKGFSKKSLDSLTYDLFKNGKISVTENRLAGFRTSLIRENRFLSLIDQKKSVITEYNKRKLLKGGETRPWDIQKGVMR